jgi:hypothetical protein
MLKDETSNNVMGETRRVSWSLMVDVQIIPARDRDFKVETSENHYPPDRDVEVDLPPDHIPPDRDVGAELSENTTTTTCAQKIHRIRSKKIVTFSQIVQVCIIPSYII